MRLSTLAACAVTLLTAFCLVSLGGRGSEVYSFDSGALAHSAAPSITVPGAARNVQAVTLKFRAVRRFQGGAENLAGGPASFQAFCFPAVDLLGPVGVTATLPAFANVTNLGGADGLLDFGGLGGVSYDSGEEGTDLVLTFTAANHPEVVAGFVGRQAVVPLLLRAGYGATWSGGAGASWLQTDWAWSGTVSYSY